MATYRQQAIKEVEKVIGDMNYVMDYLEDLTNYGAVDRQLVYLSAHYLRRSIDTLQRLCDNM